MALFDTNKWYQISLGIFSNMSMVGPRPDQGNPAPTVFFQITDETSPAQHWQVFPISNDTGTYILRSRAASPGEYLGIRQDEITDVNTEGSTVIIRRREAATDEIFWKLLPWDKGGGYRLKNVANGTGWNLHANKPAMVRMTNNSKGNREDERVTFTESGTINDERLSSIQLPNESEATASASISPTGRPSSDGSNSDPKSDGSSSNRQAVIGGAGTETPNWMQHGSTKRPRFSL